MPYAFGALELSTTAIAKFLSDVFGADRIPTWTYGMERNHPSYPFIDDIIDLFFQAAQSDNVDQRILDEIELFLKSESRSV